MFILPAYNINLRYQYVMVAMAPTIYGTNFALQFLIEWAMPHCPVELVFVTAGALL
jgi:hypothetical protein